jgi:chemotaxis protein methyltransferase CheR
MTGDDDVRFLQWALPRLGLRWEGFRRVRRQAWRRIERRRRALGLPDADAYRAFLEAHPEEWAAVDEACRITISRFARDRRVWEVLARDVLPRLAAEARDAGRAAVRAWSAGCGAGEEPYTLAIAAAITGVVPPLDVLATDVHEGQLERARVACYPPGTLRELPPAWREAAFEMRGGLACVRESYRRAVRFTAHDVRTTPPPGPFDLVLCRNLAFTYLDEPHQRAAAAAFRAVLRGGGVLAVGIHERLPPDTPGFAPIERCFYEAR